MKIEDWMNTQVVSVTPETPIREAFRVMKMHRIRHLPVIEAKRLVGIVTDRDIRRPQSVDVEVDYQIREGVLVKDVMVTKLITVAPDTDLISAATIMVEKKIGSFPVVDGEKLVGMITQHDFLRALVRSVARSATKASK